MLGWLRSRQPQGYLLLQPSRDGGEGTELASTLGNFAAEHQAQLRGISPQVSRSGSLPLGTIPISFPAGLRGTEGKEPAFGDIFGSWTWLQAHRRWFVSSLPGPAGSEAPIPEQQSVAVRVQGIAAFLHQTNRFAHSLHSCLVPLVYQAARAQGVSGSWVGHSWCFPWEAHPIQACKASCDLWSCNRSEKLDQTSSWLRFTLGSIPLDSPWS